MMSPELAIVDLVMERLTRLNASLANDLDWLGGIPVDLQEFETMASHRQSAARAVLKCFEQIEDQLARAFRAIPRALGEDTQGWFARDHADFMERLYVLDSAGSWSPIVKLRNNLVHDYLLDPQVQFDRFIEATEHLSLMTQTSQRLVAFVRDTLPGKLP